MRGGRSSLALLTRRELGEVAVVIALPAVALLLAPLQSQARSVYLAHPPIYGYIHLVVEDLRLARFGLGDQRVIKHIEDVLADFLELGLDLLAVLANSANMLIGPLGLLFLLDGGDYTPGGTSGAHNVLIGDGQQIALVDGQLSADLIACQLPAVTPRALVKELRALCSRARSFRTFATSCSQCQQEGLTVQWWCIIY